MTTLRMKHGAKIAVTFTERGTGRLLQRDVVEPDLVGAHLTVTSIMFNAASVSGGVRWVHPGTGEPLNGVQYTVDVEDPADLLTGDQLCDCARCIA